MRTIFGVICLASFATACDPDTSDIIEDTGDEALPDVAGAYVATFTGDNGCEGFDEVDLAALSGDLQISGGAANLSLDFGSVYELSASVDSAFSWDASGEASVVGGSLDFLGDGLAYTSADLWVLSGDLDVTFTDSADPTRTCTVTGQLEAQQVE